MVQEGLISPYSLSHKYHEVKRDCRRRIENLDRITLEQIEELLTRIGFSRVEEKDNTWSRTRKDCTTETVVIRKHYFGIFLYGYEPEELNMLVESLSKDNVMTISRYGFGAKNTEMELIEFYIFLWEWYEKELEGDGE